jgi:hypothetical protein
MLPTATSLSRSRSLSLFLSLAHFHACSRTRSLNSHADGDLFSSALNLRTPPKSLSKAKWRARAPSFITFHLLLSLPQRVRRRRRLCRCSAGGRLQGLQGQGRLCQLCTESIDEFTRLLLLSQVARTRGRHRKASELVQFSLKV